MKKIKLVFLLGVALNALVSCTKNTMGSNDTHNRDSDQSSLLAFQSDGIITVETSILPPATPQSFIANGKSSKAIFQIVAADTITIETIYFSGQYPSIQYITAKDIGVAVNQPSGQMGLVGIGTVDQKGIKLTLDVFYNLVDETTSGSIAQLKVTSVVYETKTGIRHTFNLTKTVDAQPMCLVNNVAHISLQQPIDDVLDNGMKQIARLVLTGDTGWTLKKLPLNISSPYIRTIKKSQLVIKYEGSNAAKSDTIKLDANSVLNTTINFGAGFVHKAGKTEVLGIYAKTPTLNKPNNPLITTIHPLASLIWRDGLNVSLGTKNELYYKEETGQSVYDE